MDEIKFNYNMCHHCQYVLGYSKIDLDDYGNTYHRQCAEDLRTRFDDLRQEQMVEEKNN